MPTVTENYQNIKYAEANDCVVKNDKGEKVVTCKKWDYQPPDAVKCFGAHNSDRDLYYLSTAEKQTGLTYNGMSFDEWNSQPKELK